MNFLGALENIALTASLKTKDISDIRPLFDFYDVNHQGVVEKCYGVKILHQLGYSATEDDFEKDESVVRFDDLLEVVAQAKKNLPAGQEGRARQLFHVIDQQKNGYITKTQLYNFLDSQEFDISEENMVRLVEMISTGRLTDRFKEADLVAYMLKHDKLEYGASSDDEDGESGHGTTMEQDSKISDSNSVAATPAGATSNRRGSSDPP